MRWPGDVLVVSCYELGRQPAALAAALAALERAGFRPAALDLSVQRLDEAALARARLVAVATPMHTALRLGAQVAARARALGTGAHVCLFGLYAALNREHLLARHADSVVGDDVAPLVALAEALARGPLEGRVEGVSTRAHPAAAAPPRPARGAPLPQRSALPALERYARLSWRGEARLVASVEASRGCKHRCRHCPIVPVWDGRFAAVPREEVLADVAQQVAAGARHVSFGDPDFLNGPTHSLKLVRELHARWPALTFDATVKVEHLLAHAGLLPELKACGGLFLVSAVESLSDNVLAALDKGHAAADVPRALALVRAAGLTLRPTLLPYTPWTALDDLPALFDFAEEHDLVEAIDPVQFTLRLLLPPGSLVVEANRGAPWLGALDAERFGFRWAHPDPRVDALQRESAALAEGHAAAQRPALDTFDALRALAEAAAGRAQRASIGVAPPRAAREVPRLTEPWFC